MAAVKPFAVTAVSTLQQLGFDPGSSNRMAIQWQRLTANRWTVVFVSALIVQVCKPFDLSHRRLMEEFLSGCCAGADSDGSLQNQPFWHQHIERSRRR